MSLVTVTNGNTADASDINQLVNVLQQPSGGQDKGVYYVNGWASTNNQSIAAWVAARSRTSSPISVTIDTAIAGPNAVAAPNTNALDGNGFHVFAKSSGANSDCYVAGNYTIQY